jgi:hypothetical protein
MAKAPAHGLVVDHGWLFAQVELDHETGTIVWPSSTLTSFTATSSQPNQLPSVLTTAAGSELSDRALTRAFATPRQTRENELAAVAAER